MTKVKNIIVFIIGAIVGSVVTNQVTKKRYDEYYKNLAQAEIESVKKLYSRKKPDSILTYVKDTIKDTDVLELCDKSVEDIIDEAEEQTYRDMVNDSGYTTYSNVEKEEPARNRNAIPQVIPPEEFGDIEGYEEISLTYYADKVLADEDDEIVDDVEETVGFDSLNHFGEYENDSVHVRNDRLKCYYEILLDQRTYSEVLKTKPRLPEV